MINPTFININVDYIMKLLFKQDIRKATDLSKPQSIIAYYNGHKNGKPTKLQATTGHKVLAKCFSEGRVINTYEKHDINASLKEMEAIFHKEKEKAKEKGLDPDKALLIRTIRKAKGLAPEIPENTFLLDYITEFLGQMDTMKRQRRGRNGTKSFNRKKPHQRIYFY